MVTLKNHKPDFYDKIQKIKPFHEFQDQNHQIDHLVNEPNHHSYWKKNVEGEDKILKEEFEEEEEEF